MVRNSLTRKCELIMESLDRFFDVYEQIVPRCFGDVAVAVLAVGFVAWIVV